MGIVLFVAWSAAHPGWRRAVWGVPALGGACGFPRRGRRGSGRLGLSRVSCVASPASAVANSRGGAARRGGKGGGSPGTATRTFRICRAPEGAGVGTFGAPFFGRAGATRPPPRPPSRAARAFSPPPLFIARPRRATPRVLPLRRSASRLLLFGKGCDSHFGVSTIPRQLRHA